MYSYTKKYSNGHLRNKILPRTRETCSNVHEMCFPTQDLFLWNSCRRKRRSPLWWKGSIVVEIGLDVENLGVTVLINEITRVRATITSSIFPIPFLIPDRTDFSSCFPLSHHHHPPASSYVSTLPATRHDRSASRDESGGGKSVQEHWYGGERGR